MRFIVTAFLLVFSLTAFSRPVLIVTTDIGQDPDDQQSLVRLLHYADKFRIAGIIANADANYEHEAPVLRTEIVHELIDAYGKIERNLRVHSPSFPGAEYLHTIVKSGCAGNGRRIPVEKYVGEGKNTEGSDWIISVVDQSENEPVHISVWGGACDLAQALWKVKHTRSEEALHEFVGRLRVYFIGKQDSSNEWILENFPDLWLILALAENGKSMESTYRGMFLGGDLSITSREWLHQHIIGKNPLADLYPDKAWTGNSNQNPHGAMKEGDSPSMLFFVENGLNSPANPHWGGWGGRFVSQNGCLFRDSPDSVFNASKSLYTSSTLASVYRWRSDFQKDFAARVQWGATGTYGEGNHYPFIQVAGPLFSGKHIEISAGRGEEITLDASLSFDPDGDSLSFEWFIYPEASGLSFTNGISIKGAGAPVASFVLPEECQGKEVHLILRVSDDHTTSLVSYKRVVIRVT